MKIQFINRTRCKVPIGSIRNDIREVLFRLPGRKAEAKKFSSLALVFVSDAESRRLNRKFLKKDHPANVLSFRYNSEAELILAPALIRRRARAEGGSYFHERRRMVIHGMLHLLGYHHEMSSDQRRRFEKLEKTVLKRLRII